MSKRDAPAATVPAGARRIFTHRQPDGDALAATYLAERFLFAGEETEIIFVGRGQKIAATPDRDCVVDVGNVYDPAHLRFDHKPPAFADRNQSCATRLLWEHLRTMGKPVAVLADFVALVYEGDRNPPAAPSPALRQSRADGYHALISRLRREAASDDALYAASRAFLDARFPPDAPATE